MRDADGENAWPTTDLVTTQGARRRACPGWRLRSSTAGRRMLTPNRFPFLQALPSFEAFGRFLETANPLAFWVQAVQMAWLSWFGAARDLMLPYNVAQAQLKPPGSQSLNTKAPRSAADLLVKPPIRSTVSVHVSTAINRRGDRDVIARLWCKQFARR